MRATSSTFHAALLLAAATGTMAPVTARAGRATCGAVLLNSDGKSFKTTQAGTPLFMDACKPTRATRLGKPTFASCPAGTFTDLVDGSCYRCPDGMVRTAEPIWSPKSCARRLPVNEWQRVSATYVASGQCPGRSFFDPRNGGECWLCQDGFNRTWDPVDSPTACSKSWVGPFSRAAKKQDRCPAGSFFDPRNGGECWSCPAGTNRTASPVTAGDACLKEELQATAEKVVTNPCATPGAFFDLIEGGTCWECPPGWSRSASPVNGDAACEPPLVLWEANQLQPPGLFGMLGMRAVALSILRDTPEAFAVAAAELADAAGLDRDAFTAAAWAELARTPGDSPVLTSMVWTRLAGALLEGDATEMEQTALRSFGQSLQLWRANNATELRDYQTVYEQTCAASQVGMHTLTNNGCKVLGADNLGQILGRAAAAIPGPVLIGAVVSSPRLMAKLFPNGAERNVLKNFVKNRATVDGELKAFMKGAEKGVAKGVAKGAEKGAMKLSMKAALRGVTKGLSSAAKAVGRLAQGMLKSAGPGILVALLTEAGTAAEETASDNAKQAEVIRQLYREATHPVTLEWMKEWGNTETGYNELHDAWFILTSGGSSTDASLFAAVAAQRARPRIGPLVGLAAHCIAPNGGMASGTRVAMVDCARGTKWKYNPDDDTLRSTDNERLCLDVSGGNPSNGTAVQVWDCNGTDSQKWIFAADATIRTQLPNNRCLDVPGANSATGTPLQIWDCNGSGAQKWTLQVPAEARSGRLSGLASHCVTSAGMLNVGSKAVMGDCNQTPLWTWNPQDEGLHLAGNASFCLDVNGGRSEQGTDVQIWSCNGTNAQKWTLHPSGEIRSRVADNRCLDVRWGNTALGTQLQIWECNGGGAQRWNLQ